MIGHTVFSTNACTVVPFPMLSIPFCVVRGAWLTVVLASSLTNGYTISSCASSTFSSVTRCVGLVVGLLGGLEVHSEVHSTSLRLCMFLGGGLRINRVYQSFRDHLYHLNHEISAPLCAV